VRPPARRSSGTGPVSWLFILVVLALALALPVLGAWVASTLVVHHEASREMAVAVGLGLSLVFPLAWELLSLPPRDSKRPRPERLLRMRTRLLLRTWAVNLLFLGGALLLSPQGVFTALSTRGDWMLPASGGPAVETARRLMFLAADGVEWAYVLAMDTTYRDQLIAIAPPPPPRAVPREEPRPVLREEPLPAPVEPTPVPPAPKAGTEEEPGADEDSDVMIVWKTEPKPPEPEPRPEPEKKEPKVFIVNRQSQEPTVKPPEPGSTGATGFYPLPAQLHPRVTSVPRSEETDLVSVAKYLVSGVSDPFQRVKVLHDYVADRVVYDVEAYRTKKFPPQTPEHVFQTRKAVCAGYSNLLAAMGKAVGEELVTVSGLAYTPGEAETFGSHAWNAVRIQGEWYLLDVTWNAGAVQGDFFARGYETKYLFMPPKDFVVTHIPDDPAWQLLDEPLKRGAAMRRACGAFIAPADDSSRPSEPEPRPVAVKEHAWDHIRIRQPSRPREEVKGRFHVELDNPKGLPAEVTLHNIQDGSQEPCHPEYRGTRYSCTALNRGQYRIEVLSGPRSMNPQLAATLEVTAL
jgi:transglutaminase-like putative cysteine protease